MWQNCLIFFILSNITFQQTKGNDYLNEVNNMLTHPYWKYSIENLKMYLDQDSHSLLFYEKTTETVTIDASTFFPDSTTEFVTKDNFQEKIIQYHLLLSCYYGFGLKIHLYYLTKLCKLCIQVTPIHCEIPLRYLIIDYIVELIKMKNSLLYFSRWLDDKPKLTNLVHTIIDDLIIISKNQSINLTLVI
ncbi:uncharacterized protein LOC126907721 [Daktulosphaira vitifoliae]|uniref:uncharacterized protein LOC126907721 n=1 Tax=Daktulosphaira vitifoliae TaxID=58002 RepID=UPI0021A9A447|nr:uncharacterized protein LOC126907721 [Daktulosphaira vitifoliae]